LAMMGREDYPPLPHIQKRGSYYIFFSFFPIKHQRYQQTLKPSQGKGFDC
jgi:hypothetical protein